MPDSTIELLKGVLLSATELKALTDWPDVVIEEFLAIFENLTTLSQQVDVSIDTKLEFVPTDFTGGSIPFVFNGFLAQNNSTFSWNHGTKTLFARNSNSTTVNTVTVNSDVVNTDSLRLDTASAQAYLAGQLSYDPVTKTMLADTGFSGVRTNLGQQMDFRVYNNTGVDWGNGKVVTASTGVTNGVLNGELASSLTLANKRVALTTHIIPDGSWGLATLIGEVGGFDTSTFSVSDTLYVGQTPGELTTDISLYPTARMVVGIVLSSDVSNGIVVVNPYKLVRGNGSRSYPFTSAFISSGVYYLGGFYESSPTDVDLSETNLTQDFGVANNPYVAHAFIVAAGNGLVNTGQVGIRVNGTSYQDDGTRIPGDTDILTNDITTLPLNSYLETPKKWLGTVEFELFIVSGAPTVYSITMNYGLAKYEDLNNNDSTLTGFELVGLAGANDTDFNAEVIHHSDTDWTYAATGFVPGGDVIISFSGDLAPDDNLINKQNFSWKRSDLEYFIGGSKSEGLIVRLTCGQNNTVQSLAAHMSAVLESLP